jgi:DNA-directed RNA polymerase II subunit RPB2
MYNARSGEQMETEIFIGPTYYMRLKHMVADKLNYRSEGPITNVTRQPTQGRGHEGGLKIGNMEADVLNSHGLFGFLKESLMERSDGTIFDVDTRTGMIQNKVESKDAKKVAMPYAFKVFAQELNTMSLNSALQFD